MAEVGQQLLDVAGKSWDFVVLLRELMEYRRSGTRDDFQLDVKNTGDEALGVQCGAKTLADELIELGPAADFKRFIRFDLGKFLVNGNDHRHGEVVAGLVVANQYLNN